MELPSINEIDEQNISTKYLALVCNDDLVNNKFEILHICCYPEIPSNMDIDELICELLTDSDFAIEETVLNKCDIKILSRCQYIEFYNLYLEDNKYLNMI